MKGSETLEHKKSQVFNFKRTSSRQKGIDRFLITRLFIIFINNSLVEVFNYLVRKT
jgi:hypothetical protein